MIDETIFQSTLVSRKNKEVTFMSNYLDYNKVQSFSDYEIIYHLAGAMTSLAPNYAPRKFQNIIDQFISAFRDLDGSEGIETILNDMTIMHGTYYELATILKDILFKIPEFQELNLTESEFQNGVSPNDENRDKFVFIDRYSKIDPKFDFIDLDACIQNIVNGLYRQKEIFS